MDIDEISGEANSSCPESMNMERSQLNITKNEKIHNIELMIRGVRERCTRNQTSRK